MKINRKTVEQALRDGAIDLRWTDVYEFKEYSLYFKNKRDSLIKLVNREAEEEIPDVIPEIPKVEMKKIPFTVATAYRFGREFILALRP